MRGVVRLLTANYTGFTVTVLEAAKAKWLFPLRKATLTEAKTGDINCETGLNKHIAVARSVIGLRAWRGH